MKLNQIEIRNFRCFEDFSHDLGGESALVVAPNGGGKSSLLEAIAVGCGLSRDVRREDFHELAEPIEIILTLAELPATAAGDFADRTNFGVGGPTVTIGLRATWDEEEQELEVIHGFPEHGWGSSSRVQREALAVLWLPADRDPARSLRLVGRRSVLAELVSGLDLAQALDDAADALQQAAHGLATATPLTDLLRDARDELARLTTSAGDFELAPAATTEDDLLRQLQLLISGGTTTSALPPDRQSRGLAQLSIFSFVIRALSVEESEPLLLVDEPELSLHPQTQRALAARLREVGEQTLIATHSSNVLDRVDPRLVVRLNSTADGVTSSSAGPISDGDANRLSRISDPRTAEAFFANRALLVEGESDHGALRALADRLGLDLDAEGVSLISLEGAGTFGTFLTLLGPNGLGIPLAGLSDADHEEQWRAALEAAGLSVPDAAAMRAEGFYTCRDDLEDELIDALGEQATEAAIRSAGDGSALDSFINQPNQTGSQREVLKKYVHKYNVRTTPILVDALDLANVPGPLEDVLRHAP